MKKTYFNCFVVMLFVLILLLTLTSCERDLGIHDEIIQRPAAPDPEDVDSAAIEEDCPHFMQYFPPDSYGGGDIYPAIEYHYAYCGLYAYISRCDQAPRFEKHGELREDSVGRKVYKYNGHIYQEVRMVCVECGRPAGHRYKLVREETP